MSSPDWSLGLDISIYQSQNSSQIKSLSFDTAMPVSKRSRFSVTSFVKVLKRLIIHLSSTNKPFGKVTSPDFSPIFIKTKRAAFHILFAKLRLDFTRSYIKRISLPGLFPVASVNRKASAPYSEITSSGSMPLPKDFDILRPCSSRTSP